MKIKLPATAYAQIGSSTIEASPNGVDQNSVSFNMGYNVSVVVNI